MVGVSTEAGVNIEDEANTEEEENIEVEESTAEEDTEEAAEIAGEAGPPITIPEANPHILREETITTIGPGPAVGEEDTEAEIHPRLLDTTAETEDTGKE